MDTKQKTLGDHAEDWARENNLTVPEKHSPEWMLMYQKWVDFCFANLDAMKKKSKRRR